MKGKIADAMLWSMVPGALAWWLACDLMVDLALLPFRVLDELSSMPAPASTSRPPARTLPGRSMLK